MLVCIFFSLFVEQIKLCKICGLMFLKKQHLNKQIKELGHTSLQKWGDHEMKSSLSLLAEKEWSVAAISDEFIGISAMTSGFFYLETIIIKITVITAKMAVWFPVFTSEWHVNTLVLVSLQPVRNGNQVIWIWDVKNCKKAVFCHLALNYLVT